MVEAQVATPPYGAEALKQFQLSKDIKSKQEMAYGKSLAMYVESTISGTTGYYFLRNARYRINRQWAAGTIDVQAMFQDRFRMNAKQNYINLKWMAASLCNTIISKLVGRWMARNEKMDVTAIDTLSVKDKEEEFKAVEFLLHNREMMEQLQKESGVQMISPDQFVPEDKNDLDLWVSHYQRIPEEILYKLGVNDVLESNGWYDVLKEMSLTDSAVTGFIGTYTWMDDFGVIHVDRIEPENAIYSYSKYNDFRDTTMRGHVADMKISEIRRKYGKEFGGKLTEEDLWRIAQGCKEYQLIDKLSWINEWSFSFIRPYDEWNVSCIFFEIKSLDSEKYTITTTKQTGSTYISKGEPLTKSGNKRDKLADNQEQAEDRTWNIYKGVYIRNLQMMLEWGIKKNMIRPQDPRQIGDCEFSYSFHQFQSRDMRNLAVPEKIEEPLQNMILTRLKMQQLVMVSRPPGAAINETALNEIDYGFGDKNNDVDHKRHFDQTGNLYYKGIDAEGRPIPVPIQELPNTGFLPQMQGYIVKYNHDFQVLKDELGEDPNLIQQAAKPRVAAANVEAAANASEITTEYMYDAWFYCMEETGKKIACLLNKSVTFGSSAYRHIMKEGDIANRVFNTRFKMLPTEEEIAKLEAMMNVAIQANPDLLLYLDTFKVLRIAKEDVELAELYFRQSMKKMLKSQMQQKQQDYQNNAQLQAQTAQMKSEADAQLKSLDIQKQQLINDGTAKNSVLNGIMAMYQETMKTGAIMPPEIRQLAGIVLQNVALPAMVENEEQRGQIAAQMQQSMQQQGGQDNQQQMMADQNQQMQQQPQQAA